MKCWWKFFHNWEPWSEPYTTTFNNGFGHSNKGVIQQRYCNDCRRVVWRRA